LRPGQAGAAEEKVEQFDEQGTYLQWRAGTVPALEMGDGGKERAHFMQRGQGQLPDGRLPVARAAPVEINDETDGAAIGFTAKGMFREWRQKHAGPGLDDIGVGADFLPSPAVQIDEALGKAVGVGPDSDGFGQMPVQGQPADPDAGDAEIELLQHQRLVFFHDGGPSF
jgi:hypothetical protein